MKRLEDLDLDPGRAFDDLDLCKFCYVSPDEAVLHEGEETYVLPALGQFVEGYVLLVHQEHVDCFAEAVTERTVEARRRIRSALTDVYGSCCFFEHGRTGACFQRGSEKIDYHAHVHCLPVAADFSDRVTADFDHVAVDDWSEIAALAERNPHYLYVETDDGSKQFYPVQERIEAQYLRKRVCEELGLPTRYGDWSEHQFPERMADTIERLGARL